MNWTPQQQQTLIALIDRIIPADDFPSASQNGVGGFITGILSTDLAHRALEVSLSLTALNDEAIARFEIPFAQLPAKRQDEILAVLADDQPVYALWPNSPRRFFDLMVSLTNEGYYSSPSFGANAEMISWKMVGYDPRVPATPVKEHWLEGKK